MIEEETLNSAHYPSTLISNETKMFDFALSQNFHLFVPFATLKGTDFVSTLFSYREEWGTVQDLMSESLGSSSSTMSGISAIHTRNSAVPDRLPYFTYSAEWRSQYMDGAETN
jgi:hypothetical protein